MKKLIIGITAIIVIIVVAVVLIFGKLDSIVEVAIEEYGSQVTKTKVDVGGVELKLTEGQGAISGLEINNPPGFDADYAFRMNNISMALDLQNLSNELIVVKQIRIDGPSVIYQLSKSGNNIDTIRKNVESFSSGASSDSDGGSESSPAPKLIIEDLIIENGDMKVSSTMLKDKTLSASIPMIHLKDIGKDKGGVTPGEVAKRVLSVLASEVSSAAGKLDLRSLMDAEALKKLGSEVDKVKDATGSKLDKLKGIGSGATEKLKELQ